MLSFRAEVLDTCCGVLDVGHFYSRQYPGATRERLESLDKDLTDSAGMFISTFVNTPICKQAYELFCERYKLLYQSEPKFNNNSGNRVFLCVFELKGN